MAQTKFLLLSGVFLGVMCLYLSLDVGVVVVYSVITLLVLRSLAHALGVWHTPTKKALEEEKMGRSDSHIQEDLIDTALLYFSSWAMGIFMPVLIFWGAREAVGPLVVMCIAACVADCLTIVQECFDKWRLFFFRA